MATLDKYLHFTGLILLVLCSACGTKDISRSFKSDHVNRLLSAGSEKVWSLTARIEDGEEAFGPCIENNTLTFIKTTVDSLYIMGRPVVCGSVSSADTLYKAKYTLDVDEDEVFQEVISLTVEKHQEIGSMQVDELTSSYLKVTYSVDGLLIEEKYSY